MRGAGFSAFYACMLWHTRGVPRYAVLVRESSNRVFATSAPALLAAEVQAIGRHLTHGVSDVSRRELGGLSYVLFATEDLDANDVFILSNLALGRGVFEQTDGAALLPVDATPLECFESDIITIQRYVGKTNEQFTHLLVNLALAESMAAHERATAGETVSLLDPVAGRGSTLNRGLVYGFDVAGIELEESHVDQYKQFLTTYLKDHRIKHKVESERIRKGSHAGSAAFDVRIRPNRPDELRRVRMVRGSTDASVGLFPGQKFDVLAGDLPYGVHHNARSEKASAARSPERLVADALPSWRKIMANGASLGLSWNVQTLSRENLANVLVDGGFEVVRVPASFEHVVDRRITRDVIVSR